jgi:hypothetical protein
MIGFIGTSVSLSYSQSVYSAAANLLTSQITRTRCPFPGNRFMTGTVTLNHYDVFLPSVVQSPWTADPPEVSIKFFNPNSLIPSPSYRISLYRVGTNHAENTCHVSDCVFIVPLPVPGMARAT